MKVSVDFDLCESNAMCEALAPEVFDLGDDDLDAVRRAVASRKVSAG